ncbi:MAG: hypothetical protein ACREPZ_14145 [Rhodanobacteraceae bacterium]
MATAVAKASLMTNGDPSAKPTATVRFATWILPPHRKDWAEAMFNEIAYIQSPRAARYWVIGCTLFAIKERVSFELWRVFMRHRILKAVLGLGAVSVIAVVGTYMAQKPYQRERISITLHRVFESSQTPAPASDNGTRQQQHKPHQPR